MTTDPAAKSAADARSAADDAVETLQTVRDWLRYGVSRFNAAGLVYGHGASNALDEAAFLILHTLNLPIDQLDPWLEARLTRGERGAVRDVIEARVLTRKPAPYLTNAAYIGNHRFYVDERVIVPRSYIGELLVRDGLSAVIEEPARVGRVLDLCTGSGCLAILAALAFPEAQIDATDLSPDALAVAARNVADYQLGERLHMLQGDLFAPVHGRRYDLIIANPPYVARAEAEAFPPEYAAEPPLAHRGGEDGLDLVRRILAEAQDYLAANGKLIVELGIGRHILEAERPELPFFWLDTEESEGEVFALKASDLSAAAGKVFRSGSQADPGSG
jgi:ribosomal protein L3 glutamine methyltransferase